MHEAIHCGHGVSLEKIKGDFYKAVKTAQDDTGVKGNAILNKSSAVFLESFVGAYFLANSKNPGKSMLLDAVAEEGWRDELSKSQWRGYAMTFAAIIKRCEDAGRCSADMDELNAQLVSDPDIMRAVVLDAMAIIKKAPNFAQAKYRRSHDVQSTQRMGLERPGRTAVPGETAEAGLARLRH
ncbi:hypothetical protein FQZ97_920780 [compost metagenome]